MVSILKDYLPLYLEYPGNSVDLDLDSGSLKTTIKSSDLPGVSPLFKAC